MLMREGSLPWRTRRSDVHPLWHPVSGAAGRLWTNPFTGAVARAAPPRGPQCRGGILADDMGLGKTVCGLIARSGCLARSDAAVTIRSVPNGVATLAAPPIRMRARVVRSRCSR